MPYEARPNPVGVRFPFKSKKNTSEFLSEVFVKMVELRGHSESKNLRWIFFAGRHQIALRSRPPTGGRGECYANLTEAQLALLFAKEQCLTKQDRTP